MKNERKWKKMKENERKWKIMKENEGPGRPREKEGGRRGARKGGLKGEAVSAPERGVLRGAVSAPENLRRV